MNRQANIKHTDCWKVDGLYKRFITEEAWQKVVAAMIAHYKVKDEDALFELFESYTLDTFLTTEEITQFEFERAWYRDYNEVEVMSSLLESSELISSDFEVQAATANAIEYFDEIMANCLTVDQIFSGEYNEEA